MNLKKTVLCLGVGSCIAASAIASSLNSQSNAKSEFQIAQAGQKNCIERNGPRLQKLMAENKATDEIMKIAPELLVQLCSVKVTKTLQIKAAQENIKQLMGRDPGRLVNFIRGASPSAPALVLFGDERLSSSVIPEKAFDSDTAYFAVVGGTPEHLEVYSAGETIPHHVGMGPSINNVLKKRGKRGPFKVLGISGSPYAPDYLIKDGSGGVFGYSHSSAAIIPAKQLSSFNYPKPERQDELTSRLNWAALQYDKQGK